ncbi:MAG TPA: phosphoribosylformylglycinamidine synthase subunit PurL [Thermoplasmata archaeon]|nr:phosphoribosylformylglycinamidine synthase subunit PurL [Thermoplasmata archaeon]
MTRPGAAATSAWAPGVEVVALRDVDDLDRWGRVQGLGLSQTELGRIQAHFRALHRDPTDVELAGLSQSWSEHCSYKSSKVWIRKAFRGLAERPRVLGTGDAGVVAFEDGFAYALRIESHNHPSAVEPYGGAATGIGGILRDVLAVGAKPIALADPLFFGPLDGPSGSRPRGVHSPRYLLSEVVAGIRDYGNRVGVPTVAGSVGFDRAYTVNPLVNVGCLGFLPVDRLRPNRAHRAGNRAILAGGLTGRDGVGGVAFASRELSETSAESERGHVQLGNPIMKEPLIHACLEAFDRGLVRGVKDLGGGGLATAFGELAHAGRLGLVAHLDRVPLREADLRPWEIWISESQERMLLEVEPADLPALFGIFRRFDVPATEVGQFARGGEERLFYRGQPAGRLSLGFRVEPPMLRRPHRPRTPRRARHRTVPDTGLGRLIEAQILSDDCRSRESLVRVYDHEVQGRTVVKPLHGRPQSPSHGDAAVLRPRPESSRAIAVTVASQPWACRAAPRAGAVWTVEEAARNLYAVGATPDALTDCLNFGNPEDPHVLDDFIETAEGIGRAARALGFALPSGNVSFYNGGQGESIPPTPVLMATGTLRDYRSAITSDLKEAGDSLYLIGASSPALGGSLYERRMGPPAGLPPETMPGRVRRMGSAIVAASGSGCLRAAHDVSDGGLAVTLFEMAAGGGLGFTVDLERTGLAGPGIALVAEGASRWVVEVDAGRTREFERSFQGLPIARLGAVGEGSGALEWGGRAVGEIDWERLYPVWRSGWER